MMIANDSEGVTLNNIVRGRFQTKALNADRGPKEQIYFARKIDDTWIKRDVTAMFFQSSPINKSIASNYGTSSGAEVELVFDNTPFPVLYSQAEVNNRIQSFAVAFQPYITLPEGEYPLQLHDWIEISDYNNIEQRRITGISPITNTNDTLYSVTLSEPLDNEYDVDYMEVRFLFAITDRNKLRLDTFDYYNGHIQMNLGFQDESQMVTLYQGEITGGNRDPNHSVTLTTQDRVKSLVETQLADRFEVDDRGVASVPTPRGYNGENTRNDNVNTVFNLAEIPNEPNVGTGTTDDITYADNKLFEITLNQVWVLTYDEKSATWHVRGGAHGGDGGYGSADNTGYTGSGSIGSRTWSIDESERHGWSTTITEGSIPFGHGDQFVFYSAKYVENMCHVVKGSGFASSPIDTIDCKYLNPSYLIEYFVDEVLGWTHERINDGTETDLLVGLDDIRQLDVDFRTDLRGIFTAGTAAIQVIDDALRAVNGWLFSTHDDHLSIFIYSPFLFGEYSTSEIHTDYDNPRVSSRYPNAANPQIEPRVVDSVKNQMSFNFANGEVFVDDPDSQANFGTFKLDVRGEDLITHSIQSGYEMTENTARNAAHRALQRYRNPIFRGRFVGLPDLLLLEIGDIPIVYSREAQFVNKPFWVTGLEIDFVSLTVIITGELATQIDGKFGIAHESTDPEVDEIWDDTGFIGDQGDERLVFVADDDNQLAIFAGLSSYTPRIGKPDRWGNYVTDAFIVA